MMCCLGLRKIKTVIIGIMFKKFSFGFEMFYVIKHNNKFLVNHLQCNVKVI